MEIVDAIAHELWQDNAKFDKRRFWDACGIGEKHELKIVSLHDAQADCVCGRHYAATGERTKQEIEAEYKKHYSIK